MISVARLVSLGLGCWLVAGVAGGADARRALHERLLVFDTHFDTATNLTRHGWDVTARHSMAEDFTQVDLPRLKEGGVDGGFWTIYTAQGPRTPAGHAAARDTALQTALRIHKMVAAHPDKFEIATRAKMRRGSRRTGNTSSTFRWRTVTRSAPTSRW